MSIRLLILITSSLFILGCTSHGKVKEFDGLEIFYENEKDIDQVNLLGNFLTDVNFTNGEPKSLQLISTDTSSTLKMIVAKKVLTNDSLILVLDNFRNELSSSIYSKTNFELHLCDKYFETKKVLK